MCGTNPAPGGTTAARGGYPPEDVGPAEPAAPAEGGLGDNVGACSHRLQGLRQKVGLGAIFRKPHQLELLLLQMFEVLALVFEAAFRHDLHCRIAPLRCLDAAFGNAPIEECQVAAAEVIGEVGRGEAEAGQ